MLAELEHLQNVDKNITNTKIELTQLKEEAIYVMERVLVVHFVHHADNSLIRQLELFC